MRALLFSGLTIAIWTFSYFVYNVAVIQKKVTPSLGFWVTIAILDWVTLISLLGAGVRSLGLTQVVVWTIGATITSILACRRQGRFVLDAVECFCLFLTMLGLVLWKWVGTPSVSVLIQLVAFTVASIPFWRNALKGKERWQTIVPAVCGALASLGTLGVWSVSNWISLAIPVLGVVLNFISFVTAYAGMKIKEASAA